METTYFKGTHLALAWVFIKVGWLRVDILNYIIICVTWICYTNTGLSVDDVVVVVAVVAIVVVVVCCF